MRAGDCFFPASMMTRNLAGRHTAPSDHALRPMQSKGAAGPQATPPKRYAPISPPAGFFDDGYLLLRIRTMLRRTRPDLTHSGVRQSSWRKNRR
jgi:hypothetical protein